MRVLVIWHVYPTAFGGEVSGASDDLRQAPPSVRASLTQFLGIDVELLRPEERPDAQLDAVEDPMVFHPRCLLRWTGVECGVEACARVRAALGGSLVRCASWDIVSEPRDVAGSWAELVDTAEWARIAGAVHFLSFDHAGIPAGCRAADLVWYPTIVEESLGLAPPQAMACRVPLVVPASGGMRKTVPDHKTWLTVPKGDPVGLADAKVTLLTDAELRMRLLDGGARRAVDFGSPAYVDWLEDGYATMLGEGAR